MKTYHFKPSVNKKDDSVMKIMIDDNVVFVLSSINKYDKETLTNKTVALIRAVTISIDVLSASYGDSPKERTEYINDVVHLLVDDLRADRFGYRKEQKKWIMKR